MIETVTWATASMEDDFGEIRFDFYLAVLGLMGILTEPTALCSLPTYLSSARKTIQYPVFDLLNKQTAFLRLKQWSCPSEKWWL